MKGVHFLFPVKLLTSWIPQVNTGISTFLNELFFFTALYTEKCLSFLTFFFFFWRIIEVMRMGMLWMLTDYLHQCFTGQRFTVYFWLFTETDGATMFSVSMWKISSRIWIFYLVSGILTIMVFQSYKFGNNGIF